ncbi:hypothetical protein [Mycolicibacterium austroafricanum]|uniref:hypothetical protein n=1 Tax=Mycolicibacterium austroafricanum TaxID=39687 RepID=UPI001ABF2188|nr:hypothetical protein [Mycolicibacterium austroafricanum]QRZ05896.1 hypothetical protein JN090_23700 [Mycolicibacterium austroafricanum]
MPRVIRPGDLFDKTDPCVKGREHLFEPVEVNAERRRSTVEDASAAPGEKRSLSTRRRTRDTADKPEGDPAEKPEAPTEV